MVVAKKEFIDSITSKVFIVIFAVFLILTLATTVSGINKYNKEFDSFQKNQANAGGEDSMFADYPEPQIMQIVFGSMINYISIIGAILAIILGFNCISGEKRRGNLKVVLSYPIFRDNLINGKFIGKISVLLMTLIISSIAAISIIISMGIPFAINDFYALLAFLIASSVYLIVFFGISMLFSVIAKNDSDALLFSILVWVVSAMLIAPLTMMAVDIISPQEDIDYGSFNFDFDDNSTSMEDMESAFDDQFKKMEERWILQSRITSTISPSSNYEKIAMTIIFDDSGFSMTGEDIKAELGDRLLGVSFNLIMLLLWAVILLAITYIKFMRQDIE